MNKRTVTPCDPRRNRPAVQPGKSIRRRDDREEIWIHKEFSEGAQYRAVLPTEENSLWIQRSSESVSPNGLSGFNCAAPFSLAECLLCKPLGRHVPQKYSLAWSHFSTGVC